MTDPAVGGPGRPKGLPSLVDVGMVHGRFQPFHNGHLEYALHALVRCRMLVVGITNQDPTHVRDSPANKHRAHPDANPFPYWLRERMVRAALLDRAAPDGFSIVPFPILEPELWEHYVPPGTVHFIRVFSPWEEEKVAALRSGGYHVEVLDQGSPKQLTATDVRRLIREGGPWHDRVPAAAATVLEEFLGTQGRA